MGAYENPQVLLDTQTPKYMQQVQESIAGSFANVAQSYAARQKEIRDKLEANTKQMKIDNAKSEDWTLSVYEDVASAKITNPTLNIADAYTPLADRLKDLRLENLNGTAVDSKKNLAEIASIKASVAYLPKMLATYSSAVTVQKEANLKGNRVMGGMASSNDPKNNKAGHIMSGDLPGEKKFYFEDGDTSKPMLSVLENGVEVAKYSGTQLEAIANGTKGNGLFRIIPDQAPEFDKLKLTNSDIFESSPIKQGDKTIVQPNGRVTKDYLTIDKKTGRPLVKENTIKYKDGYSVTTFEQEVDLNKLRERGTNFDTTIRAQATALLTDNQSAIDFYNDIMCQPSGAKWKGGMDLFDLNRGLTEVEKAKFIEDYKEYFINTQISHTQSSEKPDPSQVSIVSNTIPEPDKSGKDGGGGGNVNNAATTNPTFSETQINSAAKNFNAIVAGKQVSFEVPIIGPRGGNNGALHFYREKGKIWNEETGMSFDSTEKLKQFLREKNQERERKPLTVSKK